MSTEEIANKIIDRVKTAYQDPIDENIQKVLDSTKYLFDMDKKFDKELIKLLKKEYITIIWANISDETSTNSNCYLKYKSMAFEIKF